MTYSPTSSNTASWWQVGQATTPPPADPAPALYTPSGSLTLVAGGDSQYASSLNYASVVLTVKDNNGATLSSFSSLNWVLVSDLVYGLTWAIAPYASADQQTGTFPNWNQSLVGLPTQPVAYCCTPGAQLSLPARTVGYKLSGSLLLINEVATTPASANGGSGGFVLPAFDKNVSGVLSMGNCFDLRDSKYSIAGYL